MDASGIAIVVKQLPLLTRTKQRQVPFSRAEQSIAAMVLDVGGYASGDEALARAGAAARLETIWPEPCIPVPSQPGAGPQLASRCGRCGPRFRVLPLRPRAPIGASSLRAH